MEAWRISQRHTSSLQFHLWDDSGEYTHILEQQTEKAWYNKGTEEKTDKHSHRICLLTSPILRHIYLILKKEKKIIYFFVSYSLETQKALLISFCDCIFLTISQSVNWSKFQHMIQVNKSHYNKEQWKPFFTASFLHAHPEDVLKHIYK